MDFYFLLFSLLVIPAFSEQIPDYDNPFAPIFTDKPVYTWTDKIKITIIAPSWNTDRYLIDSIGETLEHSIKISTRENFLEPYRFTETDVNSGVFAAEVILTGFSHDADGDGDDDTMPRTTGNGPTNGFLQVERDSAVTISFEFADGVVLTESVPVSWNLGIINFSKEIFFIDDVVEVRVIDLDMNLNPEAIDQIPIQLYSDSDVAGIEINAIETNESSGFFTATVSLSQTLPSSGSRLYSLLGDKIFAKYDDNTLPKPYSISDNLEIETSAKTDSSVPPVQRLNNSEIILTDSLGNQIQSFSPNHQIQIVGTITNEQIFNQEFVYLFQVTNEFGIVESISWVQGELSSNQSLDVSQSWASSNSGNYKIETFVWNSLNEPIALASTMITSIVVD